MTTKESSRPTLFYGWVIVLAGLIIWILSVGHYYTFGIFFKPVSSDFGWDRTVTSFASSIAILASGGVSILAGALTDRYGPRFVVSASGILMAVGYLLLSRLGWAPGLPALAQFYTFYLVVGLGMGASSAPLTATVIRWFRERRGQALGVMTVGGGLGQFLMPLLAAFVINQFSWHWAYLTIGALIAVVVVAASQLLRRDPAVAPLAARSQPRAAIPDRLAPPPAFSVRQAVRTDTFRCIFAVAILNLMGQVMVMMHLVNYATDPDVGISPTIAATFIAVIGVANVLGKLVMGPISDVIGRKATLAIVYSLAGCMMLWLIFAREIWMFYLFSALFGFAYGAWIPMIPAIIADLFGLASVGALVGTVSLASAIGGAVGPLLGGFIFDTTESYFLAFLLGALIFYGAAGLILSIKAPAAVAPKLEKVPRPG